MRCRALKFMLLVEKGFGMMGRPFPKDQYSQRVFNYTVVQESCFEMRFLSEDILIDTLLREFTVHFQKILRLDLH